MMLSLCIFSTAYLFSVLTLTISIFMVGLWIQLVAVTRLHSTRHKLTLKSLAVPATSAACKLNTCLTMESRLYSHTGHN